MQPDPQTPRFVISLYNKAAGDEMCARYEAHQVPAVGDHVSVIDKAMTRGTPFAQQTRWRVDSVHWQVACVGSYDHMQAAQHRGVSLQHGVCQQVDLMVWPADGPFWSEMPPWAYRRPDDDEEEAPDAA